LEEAELFSELFELVDVRLELSFFHPKVGQLLSDCVVLVTLGLFFEFFGE
jgi:hypothetical protein